MPFQDRRQAGRELGALLKRRLDTRDVLILGLDPGGMPVADEVARALNAPLDVFVVRKLLLADTSPPVVLGAVASGGIQIIHDGVIERAQVPEPIVAAVLAQELQELRRRERLYRRVRVDHEVAGRTVVLVDDRLCTGAKMRAALAAVRRLGAARVVVAAPVGGVIGQEILAREADELYFLEAGQAVGKGPSPYAHYDAVDDAEVLDILAGRNPDGTVLA